MAVVFKPELPMDAYLAVLDGLASNSKRYAEAADKAVSPKGKELLSRYAKEAAAALAYMHSLKAELAEERV